MDDSIKKAVEFIGLELKGNPQADKLKLINEASQKFDLNPLQAEFLTNKFLANL
ncbi:MAG: hypothetical protein LBT84_06585 [Spirochaetia bacterium]|jgi:hypothetical protein|nr:hypothetical protein [Spirochaetia bacterium]